MPWARAQRAPAARNSRFAAPLRMSGGDGTTGGGADPAPARSLLTKARDFADAQFLPLGLLLAIVVGLSNPAPGLWLGEQPFTKLAPAGIFLIGGLKLRTDEAKRALRDVKAVAWGVVSILVVTCIIGVKLNALVPLAVRPALPFPHLLQHLLPLPTSPTLFLSLSHDAPFQNKRRTNAQTQPAASAELACATRVTRGAERGVRCPNSHLESPSSCACRAPSTPARGSPPRSLLSPIEEALKRSS